MHIGLRKTALSLSALLYAGLAAHGVVPNCPSHYCNDSFVVERVGSSSTPLPVVEFIPHTKLWGVCNHTTCCGSYTCTVNVPETSVNAGNWHSDDGTLSMSLPAGFNFGSGSSLLKYGNATVAVSAQTLNFTIGKCQKIGLEVGPVYETHSRSFPATLVCLENEEECDEVSFTGYEGYTILISAPDTIGDNGVPSSEGCGGTNPNPCLNPAENTCP